MRASMAKMTLNVDLKTRTHLKRDSHFLKSIDLTHRRLHVHAIPNAHARELAQWVVPDIK